MPPKNNPEESFLKKNMTYVIRQINSEIANSTRGQMIRRIACLYAIIRIHPLLLRPIITLRQHEQMLLSELHTQEYALLDRYN